jgi:hypothetical protein
MDPLARLITTIEELRGGCCDVGSTSCIVSEKEFDDAVQHRGQEKCRVAAAGPFADLVDDAVRFLVTEHGQDRARVERVCDRAGNLLGRLFRWHPGDPQLPNGLVVDGLDTETDDVLRALRRLQALAGLPRVTTGGEAIESGDPTNRSGGLDNSKDTAAAEAEAEGEGQDPVRGVTRAPRLAYRAFDAAQRRAERELEDREAYDLLKEEGMPEEDGALADYLLPAFDTWARYLRVARKALGEQKYSPRAGRPTGKSIVRKNEIE